MSIENNLKKTLHYLGDAIYNNRTHFMMGWQTDLPKKANQERISEAQIKMREAEDLLLTAYRDEAGITEKEAGSQGIHHR